MGENQRFSLGNFQLRLDPQIQSEIDRLRSSAGTGLLRQRFLRPDWPLFQSRELDLLLRQPAPRTPGVPPVRPAGPAVPRAAEVGDLLSAIWKLPAVQLPATRLLDDTTRRLRRGWNRSSLGQQVLMVTQGFVVGGGGLAAVLSNRQARVGVLNFLSDKEVPVPGIGGLSIQLRHNTSGPRPDYGGILKFDLSRYVFE